MNTPRPRRDFDRQSNVTILRLLRFVLSTLFLVPSMNVQGFSPALTRSQLNYKYRDLHRCVLEVSATLEPPPSSSNFEDRMRKLLRRRGQKPGNDNRQNKLPPNIKMVETLQEYKAVVGDEREKIIVVRFFATWCKACRAIQGPFYRLARAYPDVIFVEVPVSEKNAALHQGLGVPSLPFAHIYHPEGGLCEELRISRKFFPQLTLALGHYVTGSCDFLDGDDALTNPFATQEEEE